MDAPVDPYRLLRCTAEESQSLTAIAHAAIQAAIQGHPIPDPPPAPLTPTLCTEAATFVTLTLGGQLRGCVGNLNASEPLYRSVQHNAVGAALRDTRFAPVTLEEALQIDVHISILSALVALQFESVEALLDQIIPGVHGVVLRKAGRMATYLPQVWEAFPRKEAFLEALSRKAGLEADAWREAGAEFHVYRVSQFGDTTGA